MMEKDLYATILCIFLIPSLHLAASPLATSTNYRIEAQVISGIGGASSNAGHQLLVSGAQAGIADGGVFANNTATTNIHNGFLNTVDWQRLVAISDPAIYQNDARGSNVILTLNLPVVEATIAQSDVIYRSSLRGFVVNQLSYTNKPNVTLTLQAPEVVLAGERIRLAVLDTIEDVYSNSFRPWIGDFVGGSADQGGTFGPSLLGGDLENKQDVAISDFNADGFPDVAMIDSPSGQRVQIWTNNGMGLLNLDAQFDIDKATSLHPGDVNNDGFQDLFVSRNDEPSKTQSVWLMNDQAGGFTTNTFDFGQSDRASVADFNNDGFLDIISVEQNSTDVNVFMNDGLNSFLLTNSPNPVVNAIDIEESDLDQDGDLDAVVSLVGQQPLIYQNNGKGQFLSFPSSLSYVGEAKAIDLLDLNGDTYVDMVLCGAFGVQVSTNDSTGDFVESFFTGLGVSDCVLSDINGDSFPDLLAVGLDRDFITWTNEGAATFSGSRTYPLAGTKAAFLAVGDIDMDRYVDVVTANDGTNTVQVWRQVPPPESPMLLAPTDIEVGGFWINWQPVADVAQYRVEVAQDTPNDFDTEYIVPAPDTTVEYFDNNNFEGRRTYYRVRAESGSGVSSYSMTGSVTTCNGCIQKTANGVPWSWINQFYPETADYGQQELTDMDNDSYRAFEEYILGTDPNVASDGLMLIMDKAVLPEWLLSVSPTKTDRVYEVRSIGLVPEPQIWIREGDEHLGTGSNLSFMVTNDAPGKVYQMRIRVPD